MDDIKFNMSSWWHRGRREYFYGEVCTLERDLGNAHDDYATWIIDSEGKKLGYVSMKYSQRVAEALDAGDDLVAVIDTFYYENDPEAPDVRIVPRSSLPKEAPAKSSEGIIDWIMVMPSGCLVAVTVPIILFALWLFMGCVMRSG